jgi:hypothetical protein
MFCYKWTPRPKLKIKWNAIIIILTSGGLTGVSGTTLLLLLLLLFIIIIIMAVSINFPYSMVIFHAKYLVSVHGRNEREYIFMHRQNKTEFNKEPSSTRI